jgi:hypothetical protein
MGYQASFREDRLTIDPPLSGKAIVAWGDAHQRYVRTANADHFCSIVLDIEKKETPLADGSGDVIVARRAASCHVSGDDLREESTVKDIRDLVAFAEANGSRVHGTIVQTDGHPDMTYPVRWVVGHGTVEAQRPVLLYPLDPDGIGALAVAVAKHTGEKHGRSAGGIAESNEWGPDEANSVAADMIRDLYDVLNRRNA